ncbi:two-component regulator propeller domain-containing protein, partial [Bacteroidota bacterium]
MKILLSVIFMILLNMDLIQSQQLDSNWITITSNETYDMVDDGENIWVAGYGLKVINKQTDEVTYINKFNSDFPTDYAYSIAIDSNGNKWIGVVHGVIKYDGIDWTYYNDRQGFPIDSSENKWIVSSIAIDDLNNIWMGTRGYGIVSFDGMKWSVFNKNNSELKDLSIKVLLAHKGKLFIGTFSRGLYIYDNDTWTNYDEDNSGLYDNSIKSIAIDSSGGIWLGTFKGVSYYNYDTWDTFFYSSSNYLLHSVTSLAIDSKGTVWAGNSGYGLVKYENGEWIHAHPDNVHVPGKYIMALIATEDCIYAGSYRGVSKKKNDKWEYIKTTFSWLPNIDINDIRMDNNQNMYISTNHGFAVYDNNNWLTYLLNYPILSIGRNSDDTLLIGTDGFGLFIENGNEYIKYDSRDHVIRMDNVYDIEKDYSGVVWMAAGSISRYDLDTFYIVSHTNPEIRSSHVEHIEIDRNDIKWFGSSRRGLISYNNMTWEVHKPDDYDNDFHKITALAIDSTNKIWIGTESNGLYTFKNNTWETFDIDNSDLQSNRITSLAVDFHQNIWIGTEDKGLIKFDGVDWVNYNTINSRLTNNRINAIAIDYYNNIWIGTEDGLNIFNENGVMLDVNEDSQINVKSVNLLISLKVPTPFRTKYPVC